MANVPYIELLKDPRWQRKRLEILQRDSWTCLDCGATDKTLHVHHRYYRRGAKPWEYDDDVFRTLCEACHTSVTEIKKLIDAAVVDLDRDHGVLGFLQCLLALRNGTQVQILSPGHASGIAAALAYRADFVSADDIMRLAAQTTDDVLDPAELLVAVKAGRLIAPPDQKGEL